MRSRSARTVFGERDQLLRSNWKTDLIDTAVGLVGAAFLVTIVTLGRLIVRHEAHSRPGHG